MTRIEQPGVYDLDRDTYHADPCPEPSLSSGIARRLCLDSPAHARESHPRLNPNFEAEHAERLDIGIAAHAFLLEGEAAVAIVQANDWRTKAAQAARDAAYAAGKIPLLERTWTEVMAMVMAAREQLDRHRDGGAAMFRLGKPEQALIWQEPDGTWCRARLDWLRPGHIDDFKTTSGSANPDQWTRRLFDDGRDIQAAFYLRGYKAVLGEDATFRFAVQETYPPYALSVIGLAPSAMVLAEKRVLYALEAWRRGLDSGDWISYPRRTAYAELPPWIEAAWLEKELR